MSRIPLSGGFVLIPEGTEVFRIYDVVEHEDFGKIEVKLVDAKGRTTIERFQIKNKDDSYNEGALNAFSYLAKAAMDDFELEDIEPTDMIDHYIEAEVKHDTQPSRTDPTKTVTFVNLGKKSPAEGFDTEPTKKALTLGKKEETEPAKTETKGLDLDAILNV